MSKQRTTFEYPSGPKIIRSYAINQETQAKIQDIANNQNISVNALIQNMIEYYVNVTSHGRNIGLIHIGHPILKMLFERIEAHSFEVGPMKSCCDYFETWVELSGMKRDLPSFLKLLRLHESMGWGTIQVTEQGLGYKIIFIHALGEIWTNFLRTWFESGYDHMVGKKIPPENFKIISNGFAVNIPS